MSSLTLTLILTLTLTLTLTSDRRFPNGVRDEMRNGETFEDFCNHETCKQCNLEPPHVLALRLYSTAVYKSINMPLRDTTRTGPHPLAVTVALVATNPNPKPDLHPSPSPSPSPP